MKTKFRSTIGNLDEELSDITTDGVRILLFSRSVKISAVDQKDGETVIF